MLIFSSDNGYHMGEHRLMPGKMTAYDTDIRVPLIVTAPGVPAGRTVEAIREHVDLYPTFAALGGARGLLVPYIDGGLRCRPYQGKIGVPRPSIWAASDKRERTLLEEGPMAEIARISVVDARSKVQGNQALLVCAYPDEAKFRAARLDGAISLASFEARAASLPKGQEIIFYCA